MKSCFTNLTKALFVGLLILALAPVDSFSQKWVSKNVQKRNVLLEEFTGIHCVYCPDGHRIANELKNANPGRVVLVNVHAGGYANPNAGELDLRTTIGTNLDRAAAVSGYPAGSVNRATNPWGISRNQWAGVAAQILNMDSPVNVAVRAEYDPVLKKIKTEVEVYYTGNPQLGDKLNVVFLQDSILGSQTGGTQFYPTNYKNGLYIHNHVLRMSMDGNAWGLNLKNAVKGQLITKTFITEIPTIIGNVTPDMEQFRVVAYVAPANNAGVYTATESEVTSGIIDTKSLVDLSIVDQTVYPTTLKAIEIAPKVEITNNSDKEITSFDVYLELNGTTIPQTFNGSLKAGEKTTVTWPAQFSAKTVAQLNFKGIYDISNGYLDGTKNSINEVYKAFLQFKESAFSTTTIGFDGALPDYAYLDQSQNPVFFPQADANLKFGANNTIGGLWFILDPAKIGGSVSGRPGYVMFGGCDLTGKQNAELKYFYAYSDGKLGGSAPVIRAEVSTDWGATWTVINSTTCKQTGEITAGYSYYLPKSAEYIPVSVDLSAYKNQKFMLRVAGVPGTTGNCMWIDEISVTSSAVAEGPKVAVSSSTLGFGTVDTDKSKSMDVTITNPGDETLTIYSIVKQDTKNVFTITSGQATSSIPAKQSAVLTIKFEPKAGETYNGAIQISTNGKNETTTVVSLSGTGNPAGNVSYGKTTDGSLSMTMTPNPVVSESQFNYTISNDNSKVRIYVMDISGKVVTELVNSNLSAGTYNMNFSAAKYVSGSYFIMAEINGLQAQIPVVIAK
jgi:hypothetical protein